MYAQNPQRQQPPQLPPQAFAQPPKPRPRYRVRFGWVVLIVILLGIVLLLCTVGVAFRWSDVIDLAGVSNPSSLTSLCLLGGGLIVLTLIAKALRGRRSNGH